MSCEIFLVPCVVGAVTVIRVVLFVWDMSILRECWSERVMAILVWRTGVFADHNYMGGTRGSGIVSNADDVLEILLLGDSSVQSCCTFS